MITPCQIDKNLVPDEAKQINVLIQMKNDNKSEEGEVKLFKKRKSPVFFFNITHNGIFSGKALLGGKIKCRSNK